MAFNFEEEYVGSDDFGVPQCVLGILYSGKYLPPHYFRLFNLHHLRAILILELKHSCLHEFKMGQNGLHV